MQRFAVILVAGLLLAPAVTAAQAVPDRLEWNEDRWGRVGTGELAALGFLLAGSLAGMELFEAEAAAWRGGILFDEALWEAFRLESSEARRVAARVSDALLLSLVAWPFLDGAGVLAFDGDRELASQLTGINALSFAGSFFVTGLVKNLARRERPFGRRCPDLEQGPPGGEAPEECSSAGRYRSFHSGHAALSFTGASLICVHHGRLPMYRGGVADALACATAMTFATATSLLRVLSDKHYFSDILVGALVGVISGFLLPTLLHYQRP